MDIFNLKKVTELEKEVERLSKIERERNEFERLLREAEQDLQHVLQTKECTPEDCTPGPYCKACEFSKAYYFHYYTIFGGGHNKIIEGTLCNKANVCKSFIQKEVKKNV